MKITTVINIEDDAIKHTAIRRALKSNGISHVERARDAEEGLDMLDNAIEKGEPYDILVLDMQFPVKGAYNKEAGRYIIKELKRKNINIPIVICSSINYNIPDVVACIFYNKSRNLNWDIKEMIKKLNIAKRF